MSQTCLITGGAGYIGSILVPALLSRNYKVVVLDNMKFGSGSLLDVCYHENLEIIRGDCRDKAILQETMQSADILIPLAAVVGAPACDADQTAAITINQDAVKLMLSLRSSQQRVLYPTTNSGYGIGQAGIFCTEETPLNPISLYGVTKVEAEKAVLDAGNSITFRLATVFGVSPRMRIDLLVNDFVYRAVTDRTVVIFEGHAKRNYIHIRDVANAFIHALDNFETMKNEPYNAGLSSANLTKLELCARIKEHLPNFVYLEAPIGEDPDKRDYIVSNAKIEATGWSPQYNLDSGIRELIKGYKILRNARYSNV